ncbi:MAG: HAD family hydrolase [Candidatus Odinarchaeota archaeon]
MTFKFYIFDLDGTLLNLGNIRDYAEQVFTLTLNTLKAPKIPDREERLKFWLAGKDFIKILNKWDIPEPYNFWKTYDKIDFEQRKVLIKQNKIGLFNDVKDILKKIYNKSNRLAIVTNTSGYVVDYILKKFNISEFFHEIFCMGPEIDETFAKPSPRGILSILRKFNYNPLNSNALMIGDSIVDIIAAKKANISSCLIKRQFKIETKPYNRWEYQPDYVIEGLSELIYL